VAVLRLHDNGSNCLLRFDDLRVPLRVTHIALPDIRNAEIKALRLDRESSEFPDGTVTARTTTRKNPLVKHRRIRRSLRMDCVIRFHHRPRTCRRLHSLENRIDQATDHTTRYAQPATSSQCGIWTETPIGIRARTATPTLNSMNRRLRGESFRYHCGNGTP